MKFEKGQSGNQAGRPKGAENKLSSELRKQLKAVVEAELEKLPAYLESLSDQDRLQILLKLLPFVLPKVQAVTMYAGEPMNNDWTTY